MLHAFLRKPRHLENCKGDISSAGLEGGVAFPVMISAFYRCVNYAI